MEDKPCQFLSDCLTPERIQELENDLRLLIKFGYGEVSIQVQRHQVIGHEIRVTKRYQTFTKTKPYQ